MKLSQRVMGTLRGVGGAVIIVAATSGCNATQANMRAVEPVEVATVETPTAVAEAPNAHPHDEMAATPGVDTPSTITAESAAVSPEADTPSTVTAETVDEPPITVVSRPGPKPPVDNQIARPRRGPRPLPAPGISEFSTMPDRAMVACGRG